MKGQALSLNVQIQGNRDGLSTEMVRLVEEYFADRNLEAAAERMGINAGGARQLYAEAPVKAVIAAVWRGILVASSVKDATTHLALCEEALFHPYTSRSCTHEEALEQLKHHPAKAADGTGGGHV